MGVPSKVSFESFSFVSSCKDATMRSKKTQVGYGKETKWWTRYEVLSLYMCGSQSLQPLFQHQFLWGTEISAIHIIVNWHAMVNFMVSSSQAVTQKMYTATDFGDFVSFSSPMTLKKLCPSLLLFLSWPSCPSFPWNFLGFHPQGKVQSCGSNMIKVPAKCPRYTVVVSSMLLPYKNGAIITGSSESQMKFWAIWPCHILT